MLHLVFFVVFFLVSFKNRLPPWFGACFVPVNPCEHCTNFRAEVWIRSLTCVSSSVQTRQRVKVYVYVHLNRKRVCVCVCVCICIHVHVCTCLGKQTFCVVVMSQVRRMASEQHSMKRSFLPLPAHESKLVENAHESKLVLLLPAHESKLVENPIVKANSSKTPSSSCS
jgi:hypothetical protein